ncbi:MAG: hypothetical protein GY930_08290 [bacterium]|nr:hypothetical protein [bacterium]
MSSFALISKRAFGLWVSGALLACGLAGCGGATIDPAAVGTGIDIEQSIADGTTALAANLASAPWQTQYHGVRRLDFFTEQPAVSYRETVAADGHGKFGIQVTEVLTPHHDAPGFIAKQAQNEGFNYRYRGFRVLDPFLFETNYTVQLLNQNQMVAKIACNRILVRKRFQSSNDDTNHYLVDMDPRSGLVLAWQELDSQGNLLSRMAFESFGMGPAADSIPMGTGALNQEEVSAHDFDGQEVPFDVLRPSLLPANYRLSRVFLVVDSSADLWVRQVFTDGHGALVFMHRETGTQVAGSNVNDTVGIYKEGQWTLLMGDVNGYSLLAAGRMDVNKIEEMVSSCFQ